MKDFRPIKKVAPAGLAQELASLSASRRFAPENSGASGRAGDRPQFTKPSIGSNAESSSKIRGII